MNIRLTRHALDRLNERKIELIDALNTIKFPDVILQKHGKHYYQKQCKEYYLEIVCEHKENNIKIITLYRL